MKKYEVLVDAIVEGQTVLKGSTVPNGNSITTIPDLRAQPYVEAGILKEIDPPAEGEIDVTMTANPPVGSTENINNETHTPTNLGGDGEFHEPETGGVINPDDFTKAELIEKAKATPGAVFDEADTKAKIADAINSAIATNAANAARGQQ